MGKTFWIYLGTIMLAILIGFGLIQAADEKPTFDLKWYGYLKLDGAYDQNLTSHGNFVMWIQPKGYDKNDDQFNMTANETRLGLVLNGNGYKHVEVTGKFECDLYGGVTGATTVENKPLLMLRHAYFTMKSGHTMVLAGQSWDLVSPLNPSTLNYSVLWGCGNIGYRRPQVSLWQTFKPSQRTEVTMATGFFRNMGNDLTPTFTLETGEVSEGSDDGTDAGIPTFQGLLEVKSNSASGASFRTGISGLWGQLKAETTLGKSKTYESWATAGHLMISPSAKFGFSGEAYTGSNLGSYMGGILRNSEIKGLKTKGGWGSLWLKPTAKIKLSGGAGLDDPDDNDFTSGRSKNTCYYGNVSYSVVPNATIGFELSHWQTDYKNSKSAKNTRGQTSFILNF